MSLIFNACAARSVVFVFHYSSMSNIIRFNLPPKHKIFIRRLSQFDPNIKMKNIWDKIPLVDHINYIENSPMGVKQVMVCGKIIQETVR
jgi:hypothetical protein